MNALLKDVIGDVFSGKPVHFDAVIEKVTYHRNDKILSVIVVPKEIIHKRYFEEAKEHLKKHIPFIRDIYFYGFLII